MSIEIPSIPQKYHSNTFSHTGVKRAKYLYKQCVNYLSIGDFPCFILLDLNDSDVILEFLICRLEEAGYIAMIKEEDKKYLLIDKPPHSKL